MPKVSQVKACQYNFSAGVYLVLISPEDIPHLALVCNGKYYSLTYQKAQIGLPFDTYLAFFKRMKKKVLVLELMGVTGAPDMIFKRFEKVDTEEVTCLDPVKAYVNPSSEAAFVYQLIPELYAQDKIQSAAHFNLENEIDENGNFHLSEYDKEAIFSYIQHLNEKHAKRG